MNGNLFTGIPSELPDELIQTLIDSPAVRVERIVSRGHASPEGHWYDQDRAEWVILLQGRARLRLESGEVLVLTPGDHVLLPAHLRHRVDWTDPAGDTVWLAVHYDHHGPGRREHLG